MFRTCAFGLFVAAGLFAAEAPSPITYTKDIAPVFQAKCEECHHAGTNAPMSLTTYNEARPWAKAIRQRVVTRQMPPWHLDKTVGIQEFANDRSLNDAQIAKIVAWVDAGAPQGDPKDMPAAKVWPSDDGWQLAKVYGEPDLVIEVPVAYKVPADGPDIYRNIAVPLNLTEDKWLTAVDMKPTARSVVHHVLYFGDPTGKSHAKQEGDQIGFSGIIPGINVEGLGGWALGAPANCWHRLAWPGG